MPRIGRVALVCGMLEANDATVYTENLVRGLTASGVLVRTVGPGGPLAYRLADAGAPLAVFPLLGKAVVGSFASARASAHVYSFGPEVVHAMTPRAWPTARKIASSANAPVMVTVHDYVEKPTDLPWKSNERPLAIVSSESLRENLVNVGGMAKNRVIVVPVGLDLSLYPPRPPERPPSGSSEWGRQLDVAKTTTIGCMVPLEEGKGVDVFVKAAKVVLDAEKDAEFFIAGAGPLEEEIRHLASEIGSRGRLTLLGSTVAAEQLMPNLDVFVLPSLREALGVSLLQAMACARPVIATAAGGVFDVVKDGETGYLVPPGDEKALAERMIQLVGNVRLRSELGRAGREKLEEGFSLEQMITKTEAAYMRTLEEPQLK